MATRDILMKAFGEKKKEAIGRYGKGTIDLNNRKVVNNRDGSFSTERSLSFYDEDSGKEVLIPTIVNGKVLNDNQAIDHYYETVRNGRPEHLGKFDSPEEANVYAKQLHNRQERHYRNKR